MKKEVRRKQEISKVEDKKHEMLCCPHTNDEILYVEDTVMGLSNTHTQMLYGTHYECTVTITEYLYYIHSWFSYVRFILKVAN